MSDLPANQPFFTQTANTFDNLLATIANKVRDLGVASILLALAFIVSLASFNFALEVVLPDIWTYAAADNWNHWWDGFFQNFGTELFGSLFTFILLQGIVGARDKQQDRQLQEEIAARTEEQIQKFLTKQQADLDKRERQRLIDQMTSRVPGLAAEAVRLLKHHDAQLPDGQSGTSEKWYHQKLLEQAIRADGDLSKVNLQHDRLDGARLIGAKLAGADLSEARLDGAHLSGAYLAGAVLSFAQMKGADLSKAYLVGTVLKRANMEKAFLLESNLERAHLHRTNLIGAFLLGANLQSASIKEAYLEGATLSKANLVDADLSKANLEGASLIGSKLQGADLEGARLQGADFSGAVLEGADLTLADMAGAKFLTIGHLKQARSLKGAILPNCTKLPDNETWQAEFEQWCESAATDEDGFIFPVPAPDERMPDNPTTKSFTS